MLATLFLEADPRVWSICSVSRDPMGRTALGVLLLVRAVFTTALPALSSTMRESLSAVTPE